MCDYPASFARYARSAGHSTHPTTSSPSRNPCSAVSRSVCWYACATSVNDDLCVALAHGLGHGQIARELRLCTSSWMALTWRPALLFNVRPQAPANPPNRAAPDEPNSAGTETSRRALRQNDPARLGHSGSTSTSPAPCRANEARRQCIT